MGPKQITRRTIAQVLAGTAVVAGTPTLVRDHNRSTEGDAFTEVLAQFRDRVLAPFRASELDEIAAAAHETATKIGVTTITEAAAIIAGGDVDVMGSFKNAHELRSMIAKNVRADYANDDVVSVAGWVLSRTELLIVAMTLRRPL
jgi:hypothetical protein